MSDAIPMPDGIPEKDAQGVYWRRTSALRWKAYGNGRVHLLQQWWERWSEDAVRPMGRLEGEWRLLPMDTEDASS